MQGMQAEAVCMAVGCEGRGAKAWPLLRNSLVLTQSRGLKGMTHYPEAGLPPALDRHQVGEGLGRTSRADLWYGRRVIRAYHERGGDLKAFSTET